MRVVAYPLLVAFSVLLTSCYWIEPNKRPEIPVLSKPMFETAVVKGVVFRDERLYGNFGNGPFNAYSWGQGSARAYSSSAAFGQAAYFENFDYRGLLELFAHSLEDQRIVKRITEDSHYRIEGTNLNVWPSTGGGRITWNVINGVTLIFLFGSPFLGSCDASLQIRLYRDDELLKTYNGTGTGYWKANYPGMTLLSAKRAAAITASQVALGDALEQMCEHPQNK